MNKFQTEKSKNFKNLRIAGLIFLTLLFALMTWFVLNYPNLSWDRYVSSQLQSEKSEIFNAAMKGLSFFGNVPYAFTAILLTSVVFYFCEKKKEAMLVFSTVFTGIVSYILKLLINRPRPTEDLVKIFEETTYKSFPSGHVLFYTVYFGFLAVIVFHSDNIKKISKRVLISIFIFLVILGATSRIYLGSHWFTDILGGLIIGLQFLIIGEYYYLRKKFN